MRRQLFEAIRKLEAWVLAHDYRGYDPFDGLESYLRPLTAGNLLLERVLMQVIRQSPFNLRPLLGVKPLESAIGRGYMGWGFIEMLKATKETRYRALAEDSLEWLARNKSPECTAYSWGKHFDYSSREGRYLRNEPITVWTSLIGQVFLDASEALGEGAYRNIGISACDWISALPRNVTEFGVCLNYHLHQKARCTIHNHNMLAAALLARVGKLIGNPEYLTLAKDAMRYSCLHQLPNGAWYYGESPNQRWIDSFHSGYNLDALKCYLDNSGDLQWAGHLERGLAYYVENFFDFRGRPKYYDRRLYPIDIQCAAQAIETLTKLSDHHAASLGLAARVADWTIRFMQDRKGYFYYRQYPGFMAKAPMIHWGQGTMYRALTLLYARMERVDHANPKAL